MKRLIYAVTMRGREVGRLVRQAQDDHGMSSRDLAAILGFSVSRMSRMLTGRIIPSDADLAALLAVCRVPIPQREHIASLCQLDDDPRLFRLPIYEQWPIYLAHARDAERVIDYQPLMIPWLAQTPAYTRALLATSPTTPGHDLDSHTAARQAATELVSLPWVDLLVPEVALRIPVGNATVMAEQLHHLLRLLVRPAVTVKVIPTCYVAGPVNVGAFTLVTLPMHGDVLYHENPVAGIFSEHPDDIAAHRAIAERLDSVALDVDRSRDLITRVAAQFGAKPPASIGPLGEVAADHARGDLRLVNGHGPLCTPEGEHQ